MFWRRLTYALAVAGCMAFYMAYQQWLAWIVLLAVLAFPWLSLALSVPAMVSYRLEAGCGTRMGMNAQETVSLLGYSLFPRLPLKGKLRLIHQNTGRVQILRPGDLLPTEHCGGWEVLPIRVRAYDYLGLFGKRIRKTEARTVLVEPLPVQMPVPPDLSRFLARSWRPKFGGGYAENHELRLYRPGDSMNQVHWKLSAKTGKLIIREPMEPERGLMLLTLDVCGAAEELDLKYGRLLWLGRYMLEQGLHFEVRALTGAGLESFCVADETGLFKCVDSLLCAAPAEEGSVRDRAYEASWQYHIGGGTDET